MPQFFSYTFNYTGSRQTLTLPPNVISPIRITLNGAQGGGFGSYSGGAGGYVDGDLNVVGGQVLNIYVGGHGTGGTSNCQGGYNGGGNGFSSSGGFNAAGGGGASDIRTDWHLTGSSTALADRVAVAAGGGGATNGNSSGGGAGADGGDGGADIGQNGKGGGSTVAQGGTQSAGGAGGHASFNNGFNGSLGTGGNGYPIITNGSHSGGGGGGGYFGGGGGGAFSGSVTGQSGAGGSNHTGILTGTVNNVRGLGSSTVAGGDGQIFITGYTTDPISPALAMSAQSGLTSVGKATIASATIFQAATSVGIGRTITHPSVSALHATTSLTPFQAPGSIFSTAPLTSSAKMLFTGVRSTTQSSPLAAQAVLTLQQTLSHLDLAAHSTMSVTDLGISFAPVSMAAQVALSDQAVITKSVGLPLTALTSMQIARLIAHPVSVTMAAHGAVVDSGGQTHPGAGPFMGRAVMALTGAHTALGALPIFVASAQMIVPEPIRHPEALALTSRASMTLTPAVLIFVGPTLRAFAAMSLTHTSVTSLLHMSAFARMLFAAGEGQVLDPPYLVVTDAHNQVAFFVTSLPNRGSVRQRVTPHA